MKKVLKIFTKLLLVVLVLFVATFTVYITNTDMKLTAMLEPLLMKHYDKLERNQQL